MTSNTETKPRARRAAPARESAAAAARGRPRGGRKAQAPAPYHHGALHDALLTAAERILERDGLVGLTLRAAAREAGVSHAAPTHHFGDLTGLLSELAAVGFRRFREALLAAAATETATGARLDAMGGAYVAFAKRYPGMFTLMFRSERLDLGRAVLAEAMDAAGAALAQAVGARRQETIAPGAPSLTQAADIVRAWAMVHGYAVLLLDGRLRHILAHLPSGEDESSLLRAVLLPPKVMG